MMKTIIKTPKAPAAIGTYVQAVQVHDTLYISGQIPIDPNTQTLIEGDLEKEVAQVFKNLSAIAEAAGCQLSDCVKLTIYTTDMADYPTINTVMEKFFSTSYPARALVAVSALPKGARVEADAIVVKTNKKNK